MTPAPVGQRCPEHSGKPQGASRISSGIRRGAFEGTGAVVTKALLGLNIFVYVITAAQGGGLNSPGGKLFTDWLLFGPAVANGDWWRLFTSAFLHANLIHIAFNMYFLSGSSARRSSRHSGAGASSLLCIVSALAGSAERLSGRRTRRRSAPRARCSACSARR